MKDIKYSKASKATLIETEKQKARQRFESHFGEINLDYPVGLDNEKLMPI